MTGWGEAAFDAYLPADMVLGQADIAVVVTDRLSNLLYVNEFAARLFRVSGDVARLAGCPVLSLGLFADDGVRKAEDLAGQVLRGRSWEGTFESVRGDGSRALIRALAVPLRHPGGDIDGMVILAREASKRDSQGAAGPARPAGAGGRAAGRLAGDRHHAQARGGDPGAAVRRPLLHRPVPGRRSSSAARMRHASDWVPPPGTWAQVGEQIHYPDGHFCQQAMAHLDTIAINDLDSEYYPAPSPESMAAAHEAGLTSVIAAPLYARGELLGVMSLALSRLTERDEHHYDTPDRDLIGAIASRVAIAIDNAMLFETERQTALAFQKSLLPQAIPDLDGLEVACRYVPAKPLETQGQGIQTQVGGDWYDIIPLAAGRVGIVIGDVEGRGARAAAIMGQLRAALRAFAQDEKSPADIMRKLDEWCRALAPVDENGMAAGDPPTVSCIYMIYDAWSRELTFANAGHDAPLLISAGQVRQLEFLYKGVLLGVRGKGIRGLPTYKEQTIGMPPGAILVFYTDGLTDRRTRADGSGHYTGGRGGARCCSRRSARPRRAGMPTPWPRRPSTRYPGTSTTTWPSWWSSPRSSELASAERTFPAEPIMVSEARRVAAQTFRSWGMDTGQAELACLLVSEVVTNAVLHASVTPSPGRDLDLDMEPLMMPAPVGVPAGPPGPVGSAAPGPAPGGRIVRPDGRRLRPGRPPCRPSRAPPLPATGRPFRAARARPGHPTPLRRRPRPPRRPPGSSHCGCGAARPRCGWRSSIPTSGSPGSAPRRRPTKAAAASTWSSSWQPGGDPGPTPEGKAVWFEMPRSGGRL